MHRFEAPNRFSHHQGRRPAEIVRHEEGAVVCLQGRDDVSSICGAGYDGDAQAVRGNAEGAGERYAFAAGKGKGRSLLTYSPNDEFAYADYGDNEVQARYAESIGVDSLYRVCDDWANPGCQSKIMRGPMKDCSK